MGKEGALGGGGGGYKLELRHGWLKKNEVISTCLVVFITLADFDIGWGGGGGGWWWWWGFKPL